MNEVCLCPSSIDHPLQMWSANKTKQNKNHHLCFENILPALAVMFYYCKQRVWSMCITYLWHKLSGIYRDTERCLLSDSFCIPVILLVLKGHSRYFVVRVLDDLNFNQSHNSHAKRVQSLDSATYHDYEQLSYITSLQVFSVIKSPSTFRPKFWSIWSLRRLRCYSIGTFT